MSKPPLIPRFRRWLLPNRDLCTEAVWQDRRQVLAGLGFFGIAAGLPGCSQAAPPRQLVQSPTPAASLARFPAARSPRYDPGRSLTPEAIGSRYNNFYELTTEKSEVWKLANSYPHRPWTVRVEGECHKPKTFDIDALFQDFVQEERHYRFRCVEAWSATFPWTGFPLGALLKRVEPTSNARYVRFVSIDDKQHLPGQSSQPWYPWPYFEGLTLPEAMLDITLLATGIYGHPLPGQHGAPIRLLTPWKYGYKSAKAIVRIELLREQPPTFWNKLAPAEYDFWGNVEPRIPHPRWSQASERLSDTGDRIPTRRFNGYTEEVGHLYKSLETLGFPA